ncbi:MAG: hypothetical protein JW384_02032 [Nitrosomonadaceae bacterium]|nr:hypothetical protein [Nitrosomonadaceae bacterium]
MQVVSFPYTNLPDESTDCVRTFIREQQVSRFPRKREVFLIRMIRRVLLHLYGGFHHVHFHCPSPSVET